MDPRVDAKPGTPHGTSAQMDAGKFMYATKVGAASTNSAFVEESLCSPGWLALSKDASCSTCLCLSWYATSCLCSAVGFITCSSQS